MPHGGARPPDGRPRPPAGPGRFSQRTDLSEPVGTPESQGAFVPPGLPYGRAALLREGQVAAPVPRRRRAIPVSGQEATSAIPASPVPTLAEILARPTRRPDEPVTAGLLSGPGPGPEVLGEPTPEDADELRSILLAATSADMPPEIRGMGILLNIIEGAKRGFEQRRGTEIGVGLPTEADFLTEAEAQAGLDFDEEVPTLLPDIEQGELEAAFGGEEPDYGLGPGGAGAGAPPGPVISQIPEEEEIVAPPA